MKNILKLKHLILILIAFFVATQSEAQDVTKSYENDYFQLEYPGDWDLLTKHEWVRISIPDTSFEFANLKIRTRRTNLISPPVIEAMGSELELLYNDQLYEYVGNMEYSVVTIDEKKGCLVNKSFEDKTHLDYIFVMEAELVVIKISIQVSAQNYLKLEPTINKILASIKFKDIPVETKLEVVEATTQEFTKDWATQYAQMSGGLSDYKVTKLDSMLFNLKVPTYSFKITDANITINNWADFFEWKPQTALKDYQIFAFQDWAGKCLEIFRTYMHLGEYDHLRIQELPEQQLEFLFFKETGHTIRWVMGYAGEHQLPLNEDIILNRFLYTNTQGYRRKKDRKMGYNVPFLINKKAYHVKVESLSVY